MKFQPNYKTPFSKFAKKQSKPFQAVIEDEVTAICENPEIGELKNGDLANIRVHKFKHNKQQYLIAYYVPSIAEDERNAGDNKTESRTPQFLLIDFYKIESHENFYTDLKTYLRTNGGYK